MRDEGDEAGARRPRVVAPGPDGVLRLLAQGVPPDAIAERRRPSPVGSTPASNLRALLTDTVRILEEKALRAPAVAAFLEKPRIDPATLDLALLPGQAVARINEAITALDEPARRPRSGTAGSDDPDGSRYTALRYAEALVRQEDVLEALGQVGEHTAPLHAGLDGADRQRVDEFLLYRNVRGRFETVDSLVDGWARAVTHLEGPTESWSYDEYADRLSSRDSLETTIEQVTPNARERLVAPVATLDRSFLHLTRSVSRSIRRSARWQPECWWWFRVPRALGDQFRDQLDFINGDSPG